jgi:hypothetical protein
MLRNDQMKLRDLYFSRLPRIELLEEEAGIAIAPSTDSDSGLLKRQISKFREPSSTITTENIYMILIP